MAKKRMNFIIPLVIYPFDIMVSFGETDKQLKKALKKAGSEWDDSMSLAPNGRGRFCMNPRNQSVLRMPVIPVTVEQYGTLQHEIFHGVTFIFSRIGIKLVILKSDEAYAYLIGYITEQIYTQINKDL